MKKSTITLGLILTISTLFSGCVKDLLPSPATANANQSLIYDQNFNAAFPNWPTGWSASPSSGGWKMDTSSANNSATGAGEGTYAGASGGAMVELKNPTTGNGGSYTMTVTGVISTVGYTNISCIWGARNSSNFSTNGSAINNFAWSSDGGTTWNTINYIQNPGNSDWQQVDDGVNIPLPAAVAGVVNLSFQWTGTVVVTTSGDYRFDDFQVFGTAN